ncbi:oxidation resistance protein 1 [Scheffersomyces spartinae]|uniref:Oxidation resistance protein 1 n=1 Tax=Scheffersomyces spartinae TaxID=45513 RepID=A0A9P8AGP0_9ASCO|nr:oxidation resistance protein 1 [Scheffersomyces spartinae]KAG7191274.1 oxidation resistance protein 1 [Scheffersomyces spartinae]
MSILRRIFRQGEEESDQKQILTSRSIRSNSSRESLPPLSRLTLVGYRKSTRHRITDTDLAGEIRNLLPPRLQLYDEWSLVYSLEQHGVSLNTLYHNCDPKYDPFKGTRTTEKGFAESIVTRAVGSQILHEKKRPQGYVMVVQDEHRSIFGCFLSEPLKQVDHKRYYGNGECFLWKCENVEHMTHSLEKSIEISEKEMAKNSTHPRPEEDSRDVELPTNITTASDITTIEDDIHKHPQNQHIPVEDCDHSYCRRFKAFMYTGINDNIIYSNSEYIAIGSSNGQNGLWIDKLLYNGVSYPCETFGNEILNESGTSERKWGKFKIMALEIWRIG